MGKLLKRGREYGGTGEGNWLIQDVSFDTKDTWLIPEQPSPPDTNVDEYDLIWETSVVGGYWLDIDKKYDLQSINDLMDESKIKLEVFYTVSGPYQNQWVEVGGWRTTSFNGRAADSVDPNIDIGFWFDMDDVVVHTDYIHFNDVEAMHRGSSSGSSGWNALSKIRITYKNVRRDQSVLQPTKVTEQRRITRGSDYLKQELGEYMFTGLNTADMDYLWNSTLPGQINPDNILYDLRRVGTGELQVCQNEIVIGKIMRPNNAMSDVKRCMVVISGVTNNVTYYTDLPFKNQQYRVLNMSGSLHKYTSAGTMASYPLPYYRNNNGEELKSYITNSNGVDTGVLGVKVGADIIGNGESTFGILTIDYYTF